MLGTQKTHRLRAPVGREISCARCDSGAARQTPLNHAESASRQPASCRESLTHVKNACHWNPGPPIVLTIPRMISVALPKSTRFKFAMLLSSSRLHNEACNPGERTQKALRQSKES